MKIKLVYILIIVSVIWLIGCTDNKILQALKEQEQLINLLREDIIQKPVIYKFEVKGIEDIPEILAKNFIIKGFDITLTKDNQTGISITQLEIESDNP